MKKLFLIKVFVFLVYVCTIGQSILPDSIYIYDENKQKDWYYIQKDVININLTDNSVLNINLPEYVDTMYSYDNSYSIFNTICFSNESTEMERLNFINSVINLQNFNSIALEISREQETYDKYLHYPTDDLIMVTFKNPMLSNSEIASFAQRYNLTLVYTPSSNLPTEVSWTYVFQNKKPRSIEYSSIYLSNLINEIELDLVELAEPNTYSVKPYSCDVPIDELSDSPDNNNYTWYIQNDGGDIYNGDIGIPDADADICECWEEGLTGNGIKIGIIDFGGFEANHPDFIGADIPFIFDATTKQKHLGGSFYYTNDSTTWSHAMLVAGTIISQPNNINNQNGYSIGFAHNATFYPYLCGNKLITGQSNNHILNAIHQAIEDEVDVLNMSFGLGTPGTLSGQLANAIAIGRPNPNNPNKKRGMVVVAAIGNDDMQHGTGQGSSAIFPANKSYTLGV
ncbi:S8 family peptidase, partial [Xanthomarina sp.]|uniref:S8 family peptidase n=1 Tax=Xanthomarina sp. TaxID=1931211 RepID=UPI002C5BB237